MGLPPHRPDSRPCSQSAIVQVPASTGGPLGVVSRPVGYRMIDAIEITNFRSFEHQRLNGFATVNIIVGPSAAGKTALLEAIRLALAGTPTAAWTMNATRGLLVQMPLNPTREQFESAWSSFFFDFKIDRTIQFLTKDSDSRAAAVKVYFDAKRPVTPTIPENIFPGAPVLISTIIPIAFDRVSFTGESGTLYGTINPGQHGQLQLDQGPELGSATQFFPSTWQSNAQQVASWFSQLRIANQASDILPVVQKQFPEVTDLSPETPYNLGAIYAGLKYRSRKMPLSLLSSGINKFISLMIAIRTHRSGVLLIDEIENGIFYKMFPSFWEALHRFASENSTQLFLSTHSWECLKAAADLIEKHEDAFTLIQVSQEQGVSHAVVVPGKEASAAIEAGIEVRR